jgi:hypothetical protein
LRPYGFKYAVLPSCHRHNGCFGSDSKPSDPGHQPVADNSQTTIHNGPVAQPSSLTQAPPFTLRTQKGEPRSLAQYLEKGPVLLAFHRGTW